MHVLIVGAGITGITAALGFRRHGHHVSVYERKSEETFATEGGAGIELHSNPMRILEAWQIDLSSIGQEDGGMEFRRYDTGEVVARHLPHSGSQWYMLRSDFRRLMFGEAAKAGVQFSFGCNIQSLDETTPAITFGSGQKITADFIIGADGTNSRIRQLLFPTSKVDIRPECSFNMQIPFSAMPEALRKDISKRLRTQLYMAPAACLAGGSVTSRQVFDMNCIVNDYGLDRDPHKDVLIENLDNTEYIRERFKDWEPTVQQLLQLGETCWKWRFVESSPSSWKSANGKVVIAGDACHAMTPFAAQGAGMCIEDAAALSELYQFGLPPTDDQVAKLAQAYQDMRKPRTLKVQQRARLAGELFGTKDSGKQKKRDEALKLGEQKKIKVKGDKDARPSTIAFEIWLEDYDTLEEVPKLAIGQIRKLTALGAKSIAKVQQYPCKTLKKPNGREAQ